MNKAGKELIKKVIKINYDEEIPLFKGIYIIQERKLHESGFRLMNVIGHTDYDIELHDYKYYLISQNADVVAFEPTFKNLIKGKYNMCDLHLDINANGLIHMWTNSNKKLCCKYGLDVSSCYFEIVENK